jgi:hypothetical protein
MRNDNLDHLPTLLQRLDSDPAANVSVFPHSTAGLGVTKNSYQNFMSKLKEHLFRRLDHGDLFENYSEEDINRVSFVYNRIYRHNVMRLNYTTYDLRRSQDTINVRTHSDVMVIASEDRDNADPYWYARVIGIFHANVRYRNPQDEAVDTRCMEFLWVRWFERDTKHCSGIDARRLPRIRFVSSNDKWAFGFISPEAIVRGSHLIPAFAYGETEDPLPLQSAARKKKEDDNDWAYYYVNM